MIIGLPNETYESFGDGASLVIESGQHNRIQFINLTILENTEMAAPGYQKKYGLIVQNSKAIAHHSSPDADPEVLEEQALVVGTMSMPKPQWIKTKVFCWMMSLLYFNKLLQIPFVLLNKLGGIGFRQLAELFMDHSEIADFFREKAEEIQAGGYEHVFSKEWLNIWWPADECVFVKLVAEKKLDGFYQEAKTTIGGYLRINKIDFPAALLADAISLNKSLVKLPFIQTDLKLELDYNVYEMYQAALSGQSITPKQARAAYDIDRTSEKWTSLDQWLKEVVWYGTKKGAYLYELKK
jgi:hypothetical protein